MYYVDHHMKELEKLLFIYVSVPNGCTVKDIVNCANHDCGLDDVYDYDSARWYVNDWLGVHDE